MEQSLKEKIMAKFGKKSADEEDDMGEDEGSPTYDLACRLCEALGVDEEKADGVASVLMDLKDLHQEE